MQRAQLGEIEEETTAGQWPDSSTASPPRGCEIGQRKSHTLAWATSTVGTVRALGDNRSSDSEIRHRRRLGELTPGSGGGFYDVMKILWVFPPNPH